MLNRRRFLASAAACAASAAEETLPPVRQITRGPKFHWFGYYDKFQFSADNRYVLGNQVSFEGRSPTQGDSIRIGMVDLRDQDRWIDLGETRAFNWQQGCMLQWLPGVADQVIYNDRDGNRLFSVILNMKTGSRRTLPMPVYCVSPDAKWAMTTDFGRLNDTRPGYGYPVPDPYKDDLAPEKTGIWRMSLETGKADLVISYAQAAKHPYKVLNWSGGAKHKFNHLLFSPSGRRFIFLHRRRGGNNYPTGGITRMFTARPDGTDVYELDPHGDTSHFIWRDDNHVMAWALHPSHGRKFYLYTDKTETVEVMAPDTMPVNGHNTYLPGNRWVLNDTYPDKDRLQHPYLFDTKTGRRGALGHFLSPPAYAGEWRCDTHPRASRDGRHVCIDSTHNGGRQMYLIDIGGVVG